MPLKPIDIKITDINIEQSDKQTVEILYNQTQTLYKGRQYKFVFELPKETADAESK